MSTPSISTTATTGVQQAHHHGGAGRKAAMDAAAKDLGMSSSDLMSALRGGKTLSDLAKSKGVADKVASDMSAAISQASPSVTADRAKQLVDRMMNGQPPQAPPSTSSTLTTSSGVQGVDQDGDGH